MRILPLIVNIDGEYFWYCAKCAQEKKGNYELVQRTICSWECPECGLIYVELADSWSNSIEDERMLMQEK